MLKEAIRTIRNRRRETMVQFALRLGCRHSTVSMYEAGKLRPSRSMLILLLQLADNDAEKRPILDALGVDDDLREGWSKADLAKTLSDFDVYTEAKRKEEGRKRKLPAKHALVEFAEQATLIVKELGEVDRSLVDILRLWVRHHANLEAHEEFQTAAAFLEVELSKFSRKR